MQWGLLGGQGVLLKRPEAGRPRRGLRNPLNTGVLVGSWLLPFPESHRDPREHPGCPEAQPGLTSTPPWVSWDLCYAHGSGTAQPGLSGTRTGQEEQVPLERPHHRRKRQLQRKVATTIPFPSWVRLLRQRNSAVSSPALPVRTRWGSLVRFKGSGLAWGRAAFRSDVLPPDTEEEAGRQRFFLDYTETRTKTAWGVETFREEWDEQATCASAEMCTRCSAVGMGGRGSSWQLSLKCNVRLISLNM